MITVENLTKVYDGGTVALKNVSFEVKDGEFMAIIGLSGSGKSTLLRCINRLIEPTEGRILWDGVDITAATDDEMRRIRRKIAMIFQHFNLVNRSKVITNVLQGSLGYVNPALAILSQAGFHPGGGRGGKRDAADTLNRFQISAAGINRYPGTHRDHGQY